MVQSIFKILKYVVRVVTTIPYKINYLKWLFYAPYARTPKISVIFQQRVNSFNWLLSLLETHWVYYEIETGFLYDVNMKFVFQRSGQQPGTSLVNEVIT